MQSLPTMNNVVQFELPKVFNICLKPLLLIVLGIGLNLLIFSMIQRLVNNDPTLKPTLTDLSLVEFIRIQPKPATPQPKPDETPPPPPEPSPPPVVTQATINKPKPIAVDIPVPNLTLPSSSLRTLGTPYIGTARLPAQEAATPAIDKPILPTLKIEPIYPPRALRSQIEGNVTVEFTIDVHGQVQEPVIVTAVPANIFDKAVLTAIVKWRFNPELVDGQAVAKRARQTINFRLQQ